MIEFIEAVLALIGLLAVIAIGAVLVSVWFEEQLDGIDNDAGPFREGLDAAARISAMAFEAEQAMHQASQEAKRREE